jgi:hypothetical protein
MYAVVPGRASSPNEGHEEHGRAGATTRSRAVTDDEGLEENPGAASWC